MAQPPSEEPEYGPQQPYGYGGYYYPMMPPATSGKNGNGFAVTGIVLAILVWPLGLVFSIIGLVKSKARAGAGQVLSIVGILLAVAVGFVTIGFVVIASRSTALDPGCISAENDFRATMSKFTADDDAISRDQASTSAERADIQHFITDAQMLQSQLNTADAQAQHQSVKARIGAIGSDLGTMTSGLQALLRGDTSQTGPVESTAGKLQTDGSAVDSLCSSL